MSQSTSEPHGQEALGSSVKPDTQDWLEVVHCTPTAAPCLSLPDSHPQSGQ